MPRMLCLLAILTAAPLARASHHEEDATDKAADEEVLAADRAPQWETGLGFRIGTFHTGPVYDLGIGFNLEGGLRLDRLGLYGEYTFLSLDAPSNTSVGDGDAALTNGATDPSMGKAPSGLVQRFGLNARYSVGKVIGATQGTALGGDFWIEAGIGEQFIRWSGGGELHRADLSLGFGLQFSGRGLHHHGGYYFGFRATLAHSPPDYGSNVPTCAGPCDTATGPIGIDRSFLFTFSALMGS